MTSEESTRTVSTLKGRARKLVAAAAWFGAGALVVALLPEEPPSNSTPPTEGHSDAEQNQGDGQATWTCAMHPQIRQAKPGQCPICGMDLVRVGGTDSEQPDKPRQISFSESAKTLAKLGTYRVHRMKNPGGNLRLLGRLEADERSLKTITAWTGGRIDRLHVDATGVRIRAGQVIANLYSPEVFAAHQDLLVADKQRSRMKTAGESARRAATAALEAARTRLRLLGVPESEVSAMQSKARPTRSVAIRTPFSGTVVKRVASEGAYVETGSPLYEIANLRRLWVQLDAYETDLSRVAVGQTVLIEVEAFPGEHFEGKVTFIDPTLHEQRRTARVRVELRNDARRLRPGMFARATVQSTDGHKESAPLVIPSTAPLFTGKRAIVYVEVPNAQRTVYEARTVRLGSRLGQYYPIIAGLSEGEKVVSRGAFAIDADLQIRGGQSMMMSPDDTEAGIWDEVSKLDDEELEALRPVVEAYLDLQTKLAHDDLKGATNAIGKIRKAVAATKINRPVAARTKWRELSAAVLAHISHSQHGEQPLSLEALRAMFEPISVEMARLLHSFGNPLDTTLRLAHCPMAFGSKGAHWLQTSETIANSYYGASMLTCGEIQQVVKSGAYLPSDRPSAVEVPRPSQAGGHKH